MMVKTFLLLAIAFVAAEAIVCPKDYCSKVDCEDLTDCLKENGQKVREKGSFCRCCDICVKILGEEDRCQPEGEFFGVIVTSECADGLYCDLTTRRCTRYPTGN